MSRYSGGFRFDDEKKDEAKAAAQPEKPGDDDAKARQERLKRKLEEQRKLREAEAKAKAEPAKAEPAKPADKPAPVTPPPPPPLPPGSLRRTEELLRHGSFTRPLQWRDHRALRRIEKSSRGLRSALLRAFPGGAFVEQACNSLAHIEVASRLELMAERKKESK